MILEDGMILYHGSYAEINAIDLNMCDEAKDFGKGFYLTTSAEQARSFIHTSLAKAKRLNNVPKEQNYGYVTKYQLNLKGGISVYEFETTNKDWLYYIAINRRNQLSGALKELLSRDFDSYEVLVGKIANDDTNVTLNAFLAGAYGNVEDDTAYAMVTALLKPDRLENQFCFKSNNSITMLEKLGSEKYEIR